MLAEETVLCPSFILDKGEALWALCHKHSLPPQQKHKPLKQPANISH